MRTVAPIASRFDSCRPGGIGAIGCRRADRCETAPPDRCWSSSAGRRRRRDRSRRTRARVRLPAGEPPAARRDVAKRAVALIEKQMRRLRVADVSADVPHGLVDVPVGDDADRGRRRDRRRRTRSRTRASSATRAPTPALQRHVFEQPAALRPIQADHLVVEVRDRESRRAGVVEVAGVDAHAGARFAFRAERQPRFDGDVLERAVAQVAIELVRLRVVGDEQIRPAVDVVVDHRHAERLRARVEDAARRGDVFEGAVAAVVEQPARVAAVRFRRAVRLLLAVEAAEDVVFRRPLARSCRRTDRAGRRGRSRTRAPTC